jgi:DNA-directed RNA polymerase
MSPTPQDLINEQVELERSQVSQGLKRLNDNTFKLEDKDYASASVYGIASIDTLLPLIVERITITKLQIRKGKNGVVFKEIHKYLVGLEPLAAAAIACKITFDKVFSFKEGSNFAVNVCDSIGHAIENECQMRHYETKVPALLYTLKENYWHKSIGTQQKLVVIKTLMNRYNVAKWTPWGRAIRVKLGGWLLDCIMETSGWFEHLNLLENGRRIKYVVPTAQFLDIKDEVMSNAELFAPLAWPMLVPPRDWSNEEVGGYILNEVMTGHDFVRRGDHGCIQGETPINFLNKIQKVAYKLNPFIVSTAEFLQEKEISVGKFLPVVHYDLPPKPVDIEENKESRKNYRRKAAEVLNTQAQEVRRSCRTRMTMETVAKFKDRDRFYIPWSFDYRGRAYPIPAFLTPQDTDFGKSLIKFADEAEVTPESHKWLAFQVATTYGLDKHTWDERQQWVKDNIFTITQVAKDPIDNLGDWEGAEEPWQFLAACEEYYHCIIKKDRLTTGLCVATDATCSGLQILAGLARDKSTARLVNVLPSDRPQDAYKAVADEAILACPKIWQNHIDRKVAKRLVMTIPYNAKFQSNWRYTHAALCTKEFAITNFKTAKGKNLDIPKDDITQITHALRDSTHKIFPGPMAVMKWIEDEVAKAIKRGPHTWINYPTKKNPQNKRWRPVETNLKWTTPSGFVVVQRLMKQKTQTIQLQLLGRCELRVTTGEDEEVDISRHKAATAPNLIHSLDASLLHLSVKRFNEPITLIHDSVLCRATDMSLLSTIVRETYMHMFADHDYLTDFAQQIGAETEPPITDSKSSNYLEPQSVIDSTYFFC